MTTNLAVNSMVDNARNSLSNLSDHPARHGNIVEMQEQDRLRISQELHDDLGQRLALLEMQLHQLEGSCACPQTVKGLRSLQERVAEMDRDVHRICCQLYPVLLDKLGLVIALDSLCREFSQSGIGADFVHENCPAGLPKEIALCLYRVVQEALHNVAKHARTNRAKVSLRGTAGRLEISVEDSGMGFDLEVVRPVARLGLASIEERVKRAGGRISITSTPGVGTKVRAIFYTFTLVE
jgi:signal transduction histidine kinase